MHKNLVNCFILTVALSLLTGCSLANREPLAETTTLVTSSTSETIAAPTLIPVGITYSVDQNGRMVATGATPEGIPVSAVILANRELQNPGEASSYEIQIMPFDETDRGVFCGQDWTILDSSVNDEYYLGTIYYDTYIDSLNRQFNVTISPDALDLYTANGAVITRLLTCSTEPLEEQEDLSYMSRVEAYQMANDFFTNAGFDISDCYDIYCYPYKWLETSAKLARYYSDDLTEYDRLYPDGLTPEDGAYLLELRREIDGFPVLTGEIGELLIDGQMPLEEDAEKMLPYQRSQALVTKLGVENASIFYDFSEGNVLGTGEMISFEAALHTVSQNFFSLNPNDVLFTEIYQLCMQDLSANDEGTITSSYQPMNGTVSIKKAELGLLVLVKGADFEHYKGRAIPCWEFLFVWQSDPNSSIATQSECWVAVNALTGEYIPATTNYGEI